MMMKRQQRALFGLLLIGTLIVAGFFVALLTTHDDSAPQALPTRIVLTTPEQTADTGAAIAPTATASGAAQSASPEADASANAPANAEASEAVPATETPRPLPTRTPSTEAAAESESPALPQATPLVSFPTTTPTGGQAVVAVPTSQPPLTDQPPQQPVAESVVIQFAPSASGEQQAAYIAELEAAGASVQVIPEINAVVVETSDPASLPSDPSIASSEPDYFVTALQGGGGDPASNDPLLSQQWGVVALGVSPTWARLLDNPNSLQVAVIDSGVCANHPDLAGRIGEGFDFIDGDTVVQDEFGHGCAVAGIIAANTHNGTGMAGVAPNAQILPYRVLNANGVGRYSDVAAAIVRATDAGAAVINLSLGGVNPSEVLENAVNYALSNKVVIVAAAGNTAQDTIFYPAAYPGVVAVGALDSDGQRSAFSNYGAGIGLWAAGRDILSTSLTGEYALFSGTSFAAPHVAGLAAVEIGLGGRLNVSGTAAALSGEIALSDETPNAPGTPVPTPVIAATAVVTPGEAVTLQGYLNEAYGDPQPGSGVEGRELVLLTDENGNPLAELPLEPAEAFAYRGMLVEVSGQAAEQSAQSEGDAPLLLSPSISVIDEGTQAQATGSQAYIMILCRFSDIATTPRTPSEYNALFSATYPGLDHYWRQVSRNIVNLTGTAVVSQWYVLPQPRSYYINSGNNMLSRLAVDCANAANAAVNFNLYTGINFAFNEELDCCAWGGSHTLNIDGQTRTFPTTWLPPWGQTYDVIAHEMGHSFGMPHSSGPSWDPPTSLSIYVSQWDVMSRSGGTCGVTQAPFGCVPPGTIAQNMTAAGWLPANRFTTVNTGQSALVTLDRMTGPLNSNPLYVRLPMNGSSTRYYTVEGRQLTTGQQNYDQNIPSTGVIIHDVDTVNRNSSNTGPALVVDNDTNRNVNDGGAAWAMGETFTDSTNQIAVYVVNVSGSTFTVAVVNRAQPSLQSPADLATVGSDTPTFTWAALPGTSAYTVQIATDAAFSNVVQQNSNLSNPTYTATPLSGGTYYWRVRSRFGSYNTNWSTSRRFTINNAPPSVPVLTAPADGATVTTGTPTFSWGTTAGAARYEIQLGTTNPPTDFLISRNTTSYVPPSPLPLGIYYWRVRAISVGDLPSAWSAVRSVVVSVTANAAPQRNFFTTSTPQLTWNAITWATNYEIQVSSTSTFSGLAFNGTTPNLVITTTPLAHGRYFWRVRAQRADGTWGAWSASDTFTVSLGG